jgi:sucrose-6-phosphate hydrolase SacC (GH32 family)
MKSQIYLRNPLSLFVSGLILLLSIDSCNKTTDTVAPITPTGTPTIVNTWTFNNAIVTIDANAYPISKTNLATTAYPLDDFVFTSDGKYTRGKTVGTWEQVSKTLMKIDGKNYDIYNLSLTSLDFGNTFSSFQTVQNPTLEQVDAASISTTFLKTINIQLPASTANSIRYQVSYTKK